MESSKSERIVIPIIVAVLLIGGWGFGISQFKWKKPSDPQPLPTRQMTQTSSQMRGAVRGPVAVTPFVPSDPNWRDKFDKVYTLGDDEHVKFIPASASPERETFYRVTRNGSAMPASLSMYLRYENGRAVLYTSASGTLPLSFAVQRIAALTATQFEIPPSVVSTLPPGDWLFKQASPLPAKMAGIAAAASTATGKKLRFESQSIERPAIVLSGAYEFKPLEGATASRGIQLFIDQQAAMMDSTAISLANLATQLTALTGAEFVVSASGAPPAVPVTLYESLYTARSTGGGKLNEEQLNKLVDLISKQTGLEVKREPRKIEIWKLIEG